MRDLTPEFIERLLTRDHNPLILAEFGFDSGTIGMWTGIGTVTLDGIDFHGGAQMLSVSPITESQDLRANGLKIGLSGLRSSLIQVALEEDYQSRPFKVYLAFIDENASAPEDDALENAQVLYDGSMDVVRFNANQKTATISLSVENILTRLTRTNQRFYTNEDQQREYPGDKGFEFIAQLQDKDVVW